MNTNWNNIETIVFGQHTFNSLGQIRSLGELGFKPDVIWVSDDNHSPKGCRYINHFFSFNSFEEGLSFILSKYTDQSKKYIITTDSDAIVSLLDRKYDQLKGRFFFFNAGEQGRLSAYMPKYVQCELAERHGFLIPKTELVRVGDLPKKLEYPVFIKSTDCFRLSWKGDAKVCENPEELLQAYKSITSPEIIVQEFIKKKNELAIEGVSYNAGNDIFLPIQGTYLRIQNGAFGTWKVNEAYNLSEDLKSKIQSLIKEVGFTGVFEIEFLLDSHDKMFFLEVNFRHTQYNHALTDMGINLCKLFIEGEINGRIGVDSVTKSPSIVMNERGEFHTYIKTKQISLRNWISDIKMTDSFYCYDKKDKLYFIRYVMKMILNMIKAKLR